MEIANFIEHWNRQFFLVLNGPQNPDFTILAIARLLAEDAIYLVPVWLVWLWLRGDPARRGGLLMAFVAAEIALLINQLIPLVWFHPRPFMIPLGHTFVTHAADSSFPSDHIAFLAGIAIGLVCWRGGRKSGLVIGAMAVPVAWARIYLGIHFPLDMIGAVIVAAVATVISMPLWPYVNGVIMPKLVTPVYRRVFSWPIRRGWVRD
ncbi:undecaprenyl-diphosphatase [Thalassospira mesophila]|uniref:Phosphatidic acid phosphatase type 2/haloperoxidase domain-containing protein n=1 Tax=Thalassospira mesophila TaxID=1293891 RepID=A0A1Y2KXK6_9PROT|nr:undecaprenyl-diphosphatase [Thalassospira mesophila]OSQ35986.1 hypothetical protein TMES_19355 [Thalassospira mesophila]